MCEGLIVPSRGVNVLAMVQGILWVALPMLEIMGCSRASGLWILGKPYNGIVRWCLMSDVQVFGYL